MTDNEPRLVIREYADYSITYNTYQKRFEALKDGEVKLKSDKESYLIEKVENAVKRQKKVVTSNIFPMEIYYKKDQYHFIDARITSMAEDGEFWVSWNEGKESHRSKMSARWHEFDFYPINEKNTAIKDKVSSLNTQMQVIHNNIYSAFQELGKGIDLESLTKIEEAQ